MKTNRMTRVAAAVMLLSVPVSAGAIESGQDELSKSLSDDLSAVSQSLESEWDELSSDPEFSGGATQRWYFQQFRVRLQGKAGVEVPWLAGLEIVPEVEMVFQRTSPEGWTSYKP